MHPLVLELELVQDLYSGASVFSRGATVIEIEAATATAIVTMKMRIAMKMRKMVIYVSSSCFPSCDAFSISSLVGQKHHLSRLIGPLWK